MTAGAFSVRAPGKLILCGEYAVVHGTPALCLAVARHARCRATPSTGGLTLQALGSAALTVRRTPGGDVAFHPDPDPPERFALVRSVLALSSPVSGWDLSLDSDALSTADLVGGAPVKLGLGSSAAAAVALAAALDHVRDPALTTTATRRRWFELAQRAHAAAQGGLGSGIDVAASAFGGLFVYTRPDADPARADIVAADRQRLGVEIVTAWTGVSASTPALLGRVEAWRREAPGSAHNRFREMDRVARDAAAAARGGDARALIDAVHAYGEQMQKLGRESGTDIVTAAHRRVRDLAACARCAAKPSGAGGGDVAVCLCPGPSEAEQLRGLLRDAGIATLQLAPDDKGATVEDG